MKKIVLVLMLLSLVSLIGCGSVDNSATMPDEISPPPSEEAGSRSSVIKDDSAPPKKRN